MNGLLASAQAASAEPPMDAPPEMGGDAEMGADPQMAPEEEIETEDMTEEEEQIFATVSAEVVRAVMAPQYIERVLRRMEKNDPVVVCAEEAVRAVDVFDGALGQSVPREIVGNVCVQVAAAIHEVAVEAKALENDEETAQNIIGATLAKVAETFGEDDPEAEDGEQ